MQSSPTSKEALKTIHRNNEHRNCPRPRQSPLCYHPSPLWSHFFRLWPSPVLDSLPRELARLPDLLSRQRYLGGGRSSCKSAMHRGKLSRPCVPHLYYTIKLLRETCSRKFYDGPLHRVTWQLKHVAPLRKTLSAVARVGRCSIFRETVPTKPGETCIASQFTKNISPCNIGITLGLCK